MAPTSIAEYRARKELQAKVDTSVDQGVFVAHTLMSIEAALHATGNPVDAALWAIADLLDEAIHWSPQEIATASDAIDAEVQRRNRESGR